MSTTTNSVAPNGITIGRKLKVLSDSHYVPDVVVGEARGEVGGDQGNPPVITNVKAPGGETIVVSNKKISPGQAEYAARNLEHDILYSDARLPRDL